MAKGGGNKKRFQYCIDSSGKEFFLSWSSPTSFRTQSHWSFITGQCINSERFLRVHLSLRMCNQFTFHHEFRIDTRRTNFGQKTDGILHICGSWEQGTQRSGCNWRGCTASCIVQAKEESASTFGVLGRHQTRAKERIFSSMKHDRTQSSFTTRFQLIVSRRISWWELERSYTRKKMRHLDFLRRFLLKTIGWKNWVQKLLEVVKTPNKPN